MSLRINTPKELNELRDRVFARDCRPRVPQPDGAGPEGAFAVRASRSGTSFSPGRIW